MDIFFYVSSGYSQRFEMFLWNMHKNEEKNLVPKICNSFVN